MEKFDDPGKFDEKVADKVSAHFRKYKSLSINTFNKYWEQSLKEVGLGLD